MSKTTQPTEERSLGLSDTRLAALLRQVVAEESVESVLASLLATLRELIRCEDVVVWELTADEALQVAAVDGEDEQAMRSLRIGLGEGLTGKAALLRQSVVSNNAHVDPAAGYVPGTAQIPEAVACTPLLARGRLLGVLTLYRQGEHREFANDEVGLVADFSAVAAIALDNAQTRSELERLATTDELTGLPNRRCFLQQLERELASTSRYGSPLSLLLLDLDNFKVINDTQGHSAGDRALKLVARSIESCLRAPDFAARLGGDEFAVLLRHTDQAAAAALADRLGEAISLLPLGIPLTVSIGLSTMTDSGATDLLDDADRLLYDVKRSKVGSVATTVGHISASAASESGMALRTDSRTGKAVFGCWPFA